MKGGAKKATQKVHQHYPMHLLLSKDLCISNYEVRVSAAARMVHLAGASSTSYALLQIKATGKEAGKKSGLFGFLNN